MFKAIIRTTAAMHIINSENLEEVLEAIRNYTDCPQLEEVKLLENEREVPSITLDIFVKYGADCEILDVYNLSGWTDGDGDPITVLGLRIRWFAPEGVEFIDEVTYSFDGRWGAWDGEVDEDDILLEVDLLNLRAVDDEIRFDVEENGLVLVDDEDEDELPF